MKKVLLLIDQKARDLISVMLIGEYLKKFGISVYYCNKGNMLASAEKYKPDVFVMSCSEGQYRDLALYIAPTCKIVLMTQEGACATKESTLMRHTFNNLGEECYIRGLSRVYLWGDKSKKWLIEGGVYPEEIIRTYGTSRLDPYLVGGSASSEKKQRYRVGFANRGASINPMRRENPIEQLEQVRTEFGPHRAYLDKDREWEDWIWHSIASVRINLKLLEKLAVDYEIIWRPDPYEDHSAYEFLCTKYSHFTIDSDPLLMNFINSIDVLVTEFSTTGTEALMLKKPVISTQRLLGERLRDHNSKSNHLNPEHARFYWQPNTELEFFEILSGLKKGELPYSPAIEEAEEYLKTVYGWNSKSASAASLIACDIKELCENKSSPAMAALHRSEFAEHPFFLRLSNRLNIPLALTKKLFAHPIIMDIVFLFRSFQAGSFLSSLNSEYFSWHDRKRAVIVNRLFEKIESFDRHVAKMHKKNW